MFACICLNLVLAKAGTAVIGRGGNHVPKQHYETVPRVNPLLSHTLTFSHIVAHPHIVAHGPLIHCLQH